MKTLKISANKNFPRISRTSKITGKLERSGITSQDLTTSGVGQREERQKDERSEKSLSDGQSAEESHPYLGIYRTRTGGLSAICSRAMRESRSAASCARTGLLRERESCSCEFVGRPSPAHARFPDRSPALITGLWKLSVNSGNRIGKGHLDPINVDADPIALRRSKRRKPGALAVREIDPRHPANQPAGANSRVTPVLALSHSRTTARVGRTCSPNRQESMKNCVWKVSRILDDSSAEKFKNLDTGDILRIFFKMEDFGWNR